MLRPIRNRLHERRENYLQKATQHQRKFFINDFSNFTYLKMILKY